MRSYESIAEIIKICQELLLFKIISPELSNKRKGIFMKLFNKLEKFNLLFMCSNENIIELS